MKLSPNTTGYTVAGLWDVHLDARHPLPQPYKLAKRFVKDTQPDVLVVGGDFADMGCISRYNKDRHLTKERMRYKHDCRLAADELAELRDCCKEMVFLEGNHEAWIRQYVDKHPELSEFMNMTENFGLDKLQCLVVPENEVCSIGKMNFIHGQFFGKYHTRKHFDEFKDNIFYGHTHDRQSFHRRIKHNSHEYESASFGCLCHRDPEYWRGKPNNWAWGFGWFEAREDHNFNSYFIRIVNNACTYGGQTWAIN